MTEIAGRIKAIRSEWNLTQKELADRIGVTNAHISKIEKGLTVPSRALTKLICQEFKVSEQWLLHGKGPANIEELDEIQDDAMYRTTRRLNELLGKDGIVRSLMVELETLFSDIVTPPYKAELEIIEYLTLCHKLFTHLENYVDAQKKNLRSPQLMMLYSKDDLLRDILSDIDRIEKYFESKQQ